MRRALCLFFSLKKMHKSLIPGLVVIIGSQLHACCIQQSLLLICLNFFFLSFSQNNVQLRNFIIRIDRCLRHFFHASFQIPPTLKMWNPASFCRCFLRCPCHCFALDSCKVFGLFLAVSNLVCAFFCSAPNEDFCRPRQPVVVIPPLTENPGRTNPLNTESHTKMFDQNHASLSTSIWNLRCLCLWDANFFLAPSYALIATLQTLSYPSESSESESLSLRLVHRMLPVRSSS